MKKLKSTASLVKSILEVDKQARNSDSFLYFKVIQHEAEIKGIDLRRMSVSEFLLGMNVFGFTGFETVRRARQKIQATHPELAACEKVARVRKINEDTYLAFALGAVE